MIRSTILCVGLLSVIPVACDASEASEQQTATHVFSHQGEIVAIAFRSKDDSVVSCTDKLAIHVWDLVKGTGESTIVERDNRDGTRLGCCDLSLDGRICVRGFASGVIELINVEQKKVFASWQGHQSCVNGVVFSPDGTAVASAGNDDITIWDADTKKQKKTSKVTATSGDRLFSLNSLAISKNGKSLASGGSSFARSCAVQVWDASSLELQNTFDGHLHNILSITFSPDGKTVATSGPDNTVVLWETQTGKQIRIMPTSTSAFGLQFAPDGKLLAAGVGTQIWLWNLTNKEASPIGLEGHTGAVLKLQFNQKGNRLASGSRDTTVRVWEVSK
ncbi:MAG: (Myosin heavy-chain) kinase [Schlesneria sp.]|nr:(Myosin heavy-chain) kinase [Schlesneria sp.]